MAMEKVGEVVRVPKQMVRHPTPGGILHGCIDIDLGEFFVGKRVERFHMRISADKLPELVQRISGAKGCSLNFGFGAIQVFQVATAENMKPKSVK